MKYNQPYDQPSNPNAPYVDGNPAAGIEGSIVPAAAVEFPQREIVNVIANNKLTPSNNDLGQLLEALKMTDVMNVLKTSTNYGTDTQWSAQIPALPVTQPYFGTALWFKPGFPSRKGGTVFSLNGCPFKAVTQVDLSPVDIGDVEASSWLLLFYDGTEWLVLAGSSSRAGQIPLLTTNAYWYVNGTTGDDNFYDGTSPTVQSATVGPFLTIQRAVNETYKYNMNGYNQFINIADGNYGPVQGAQTNGIGTVYLIGNVNTPANVSIVNTINNQCAIFIYGGRWAITGVRVANLATSGPSDGIAGNLGQAVISLYGKLQFGPCFRSHLLTAWGAVMAFNGGTQIIVENGANAQYHIAATENGPIYFATPPGPNGFPTITFLGPVNFSGAFTAASGCAISWLPYGVITNKGFASGSKYIAFMNGVMTGGQGDINFYPGTTPGSTSSGGQYG